MVNLNAQGTKNMMRMKRGDEDLVEDEYTIKKNQMYRDEEFDTGAIDATESLAEQKVTGRIPVLKNNKNALIRNSKPFSQRLKSGELKIDVRDVYAVAN